MTIENTGVALARRAAEALEALDQHGPHLRPPGSDRFGWTADVLDELARVAALLGRAVDHASGDVCPAVGRETQELVDAIVAHRNTMLQPARHAAADVRAALDDRTRRVYGPSTRT
ncbi:hypothetical protein [Actinomycetospora sp. CA-084318]|uniref:hypothetical protein n=1 Tax=Actinomycetospora sp. CA-084318 TaxID=3239892 RepID=UPI003D97B5CD